MMNSKADIMQPFPTHCLILNQSLSCPLIAQRKLDDQPEYLDLESQADYI